MKNIAIICTILFFCNYSYSKSKNRPVITVYEYKKTIILYDRKKDRLDTIYSFFKILINKNKMYFIDSIINNNRANDSSAKLIGTYIIKKGKSYLKIERGDNIPIYNINGDTVKTQLEGINHNLFYSGNGYNSKVDTLIGSNDCFKFIRNHEGNPGIDVPEYTEIEYVNKTDFLPILIKLMYRAPWREIVISRL